MMKKMFALSLSVMMGFILVACGKGDEQETTTKLNDIGEKGEITLGEYKGLTVYSDEINVKDSELEAYINERLELDSTTEYVKTGVVKENDKVKLSYKGTIDGKEFSGGTTEGTVIVVNEDGFKVKGFTDALKGKNIGETLELDLKMPDDYTDEELKGKPVHFSVKLDALVVINVPELTDEYVEKEYSEIGLKTVAQFTEYLKNDLYINNIYAKIWTSIVESSEVKMYEKTRYDEYFKIVSDNYTAQIQSSYGMSIDDYLTQNGMTKEQWDANLANYVKGYLKEEMVIEEIAKLENINVTDEQFNKKMMEYAKLYGFDSVEEFKKSYEDVKDEEFQFSVLAYYVQEFVAKQAKVVAGSDPNKATTTQPTTPANEETTPANEETTTAN